ncbi:MAG: HD domain-containing protein [Deltaproteobacteria bacterium]|nr:HD domain-containing protein [Deltaproteobacteria bacterium]
MNNSLETDLRARVRAEEDQHSRNDRGSDSLWDHLERVAKLAEYIGHAENVDPQACRLAGLFHDAGKFAGGRYHDDDNPEEERSVEVLAALSKKHGIDATLVDQVAEAIRQIYRDDPDPAPLAQVLFDADNLDKLGPLGVANYFVKAGLRGGGISSNLLYRLTVELTYARHAPRCLMTKTGREMAGRRAPKTTRFLKDFLDDLRRDDLYDFHVIELIFDGLVLDVVAPVACACGVEIKRRIWEIPGIKCSEIHLEHACASCEMRHEIRFCRPRLTI